MYIDTESTIRIAKQSNHVAIYGPALHYQDRKFLSKLQPKRNTRIEMRVTCIALILLFGIARTAPAQDYNEKEAQKVNLEKRFIFLAPAVIGTAISAVGVGGGLLMNYINAKKERKTIQEEMAKTRKELRPENVEQSIVDGFENSLSKVIHGMAEMRAHKANKDYEITPAREDSVYDAVLEHEWDTKKAEIDKRTSKEDERKKKYETAQQTIAIEYANFETKYLLATLKAQETGKPAPTPDEFLSGDRRKKYRELLKSASVNSDEDEFEIKEEPRDGALTQ